MAGKEERVEGRLRARPAATSGAGPVGLRPLELGGARDGYAYVPPTYDAERPAPLVVLLHGAGEDARDGLALLRAQADEAGLILLAPSSLEYTWDLLVSRRYGSDVTALDRALEHVFSRYAVDTTRIAVGGYSDGASYALSLGITNGDLFTDVLAFSPGFVAPNIRRVGSPRIFVSHGTRDRWLPVDRCSRVIVPRLQSAGYEVCYREFEGGHVVPPEIALGAVCWFVAERG